MSELLRDLRLALRMLLRAPSFSLAAIATLTLAIGINTALFSVVSAVLLRPLPFRAPDRLVVIWETVGREQRRFRVASGNYEDWRTGARSFAQMAIVGAATATLTGEGDARQLLGARVSASYFDVLGVRPLLGRTFNAEEDLPGSGAVLILGHEIWQQQFGARPDVVGRMVTFNGQRRTVIGVMPAGVYPTWPAATATLSFGSRQDYWIPIGLNPDVQANRRMHVFAVIARLRNGVDLPQANADMRAVAARLATQYPASNADESAVVRGLEDEMVGAVRQALLTLLGAVAVVLLVACVNVANLLLARGVAREREFAVRRALGASPWRLLRQLVAESLAIAAAAGALGIGLAFICVRVLVAIIPQDIPRLHDVAIDAPVLLFAIGLSALVAAVFGTVPALHQARRTSLRAMLTQGARTAGLPPGRERARQGLVAAEIALAAMLVLASGLLVKSYWTLRQDRGRVRPHQRTRLPGPPSGGAIRAVGSDRRAAGPPDGAPPLAGRSTRRDVRV